MITSYRFAFNRFQNLSKILAKFKKPDFTKLERSERYNQVNETLLECIQKEKEPCFLLPAVLDFIDQVSEEKQLHTYTLNSFEFWLNQFSRLSDQENLRIRAKIAGRHIPRDDYQTLFPIGMGKRYPGSHFVTGHGSPDLDTAVASFWGWLDAFAARVSEGLHIWNLPPGGILTTQEASPLTDVLGTRIFRSLSQNRSSLTLSGLDFTSQKNLIKKNLKDSTLDSEHVRHKNACMVVDDKGYFLGDLRTADYEGIRQIQSIVTYCLIWFENVFHSKFIALFTKQKVQHQDIISCVNDLFDLPIKKCLETKNLSPAFFEHFNHYLLKILGLEEGLDATFKAFAQALEKHSLSGLLQFKTGILDTFKRETLFDKLGKLIENRPKIFKMFNTIIHDLDQALKELQLFTESIDVALKIKRKSLVFYLGMSPPSRLLMKSVIK